MDRYEVRTIKSFSKFLIFDRKSSSYVCNANGWFRKFKDEKSAFREAKKLNKEFS